MSNNDINGYTTNELADKIIAELTSLAEFVDEKSTSLTDDDLKLISSTVALIQTYHKLFELNLQKIQENYAILKSLFNVIKRKSSSPSINEINELGLFTITIEREISESKQAMSRLGKTMPALHQRIYLALKELKSFTNDDYINKYPGSYMEYKKPPPRVPFSKI